MWIVRVFRVSRRFPARIVAEEAILFFFLVLGVCTVLRPLINDFGYNWVLIPLVGLLYIMARLVVRGIRIIGVLPVSLLVCISYILWGCAFLLARSPFNFDVTPSYLFFGGISIVSVIWGFLYPYKGMPFVLILLIAPACHLAIAPSMFLPGIMTLGFVVCAGLHIVGGSIAKLVNSRGQRTVLPSHHEVVLGTFRLFVLCELKVMQLVFILISIFAVLTLRDLDSFDGNVFAAGMVVAVSICLVMGCFRVLIPYLLSSKFRVKISVANGTLTITDVSWVPHGRPQRILQCALEHCRIIPDFEKAEGTQSLNVPLFLCVPIRCCFIRFWVRLSCGLTPDAHHEWIRVFERYQTPTFIVN